MLAALWPLLQPVINHIDHTLRYSKFIMTKLSEFKQEWLCPGEITAGAWREEKNPPGWFPGFTFSLTNPSGSWQQPSLNLHTPWQNKVFALCQQRSQFFSPPSQFLLVAQLCINNRKTRNNFSEIWLWVFFLSLTPQQGSVGPRVVADFCCYLQHWCRRVLITVLGSSFTAWGCCAC